MPLQAFAGIERIEVGLGVSSVLQARLTPEGIVMAAGVNVEAVLLISPEEGLALGLALVLAMVVDVAFIEPEFGRGAIPFGGVSCSR